MKILCVAEKPFIARSISEILSSGQARATTGRSPICKNFEFDYQWQGRPCQVVVTSVAGHLAEVDFAQAYGWRQCNPEALFDAPIQERVHENHKDKSDNLKQLAPSCTHLMIWTDYDREGEKIGDEVVQVCKAAKAHLCVLRAKFSALNHREIHQAMQNPIPMDQRLIDAVAARTELDLRIGAAFTRVQTLTLQPLFTEIREKIISYGPCQFPTLGFIVDRFLKIERFVPEPFWKLEMTLEKTGLTASFGWLRNHLFDQKCCLVLYEQCRQARVAKVIQVTARPTSKWRPVPLTTVEMQKLGTAQLRISSDRIMVAAEKLYNSGFISYPRTETNEFENSYDLKGFVQKQTHSSQWGSFAQNLLDGGFSWPRSGGHNDKAHPPIHPVAFAANLSGDEQRVYEMIVRCFLAACSTNALAQETVVMVQMAQERFSTSGLSIIAKNYLDVYPYERWTSRTIPSFTKNETFVPTTLEMTQGSTTAPSLLDERALITLMQKHEIGTDATIHEHIKKVLEREYAFKEANRLFYPSTLGVALVVGYNQMSLEFSLSKPFLRTRMERDLKEICQGAKSKTLVVEESKAMYRRAFMAAQAQWHHMSASLQKYFGHAPDGALGTLPTNPESAFVCKCPQCGQDMHLRALSDKWLVGCKGYPRCRASWWVSGVASSVKVTDQPCTRCAQSLRARLLEFQFIPQKVPPSVPASYVGCIAGCDETLVQLFNLYQPARSESTGVSASLTTRPASRSYQSSAQGSYGSQNQGSIHTPAPSHVQEFQNHFAHTTLIQSTKPKCHCSLFATLKTCNKGPNQGRNYYACTRSFRTCKFFQWEEQGG